MDIQTLDAMLEQYNELELKLVDYINKENAQFVETEEMKILQAYADTSRVLIGRLYKEMLDPNRCDIRHLTSQGIVTHHQSPELFLESLRYRLNIKAGSGIMPALKDLNKKINKLIE